MFHDPHDLEIAAFFVLIALFEAWEHVRPARAVDRRAHWRLDLLCCALALAMNRASTHAVEETMQAVAPQLALDALATLRGLPSWIKIVGALVVVDFLLYWMHRAQHRFDL